MNLNITVPGDKRLNGDFLSFRWRWTPGYLSRQIPLHIHLYDTQERDNMTWRVMKSHLPNKNNHLFYKCKSGIYCWSLVHIWVNITKYCSAQSMFLWDYREHYINLLNNVLVFTTVIYTDKLISGFFFISSLSVFKGTSVFDTSDTFKEILWIPQWRKLACGDH